MSNNNQGDEEASIEEQIPRVKIFLELTSHDPEILKGYQPYIEKATPEIVEKFNEHITKFDFLASLFKDQEMNVHLKKIWMEYLFQLFSGDYDKDYFSKRIKIGRTHERVGLAPMWYMGAYAFLSRLLFDTIQEEMEKNCQEFSRVLNPLGKVINMDMQLAIEAYEKSHQEAMEKVNKELENYSKNLEMMVDERTSQMEESNRMKDLFTDIMHHDLLNPLGIANGIIEIYGDDETDPEKKKYIDIIKRNLTRSVDLIESATKLSKLDSIEGIESGELDLNLIIKNVIENFQIMLSDAKMNIENRISIDMLITGNKIIEEVFVNLISNAIKYAPEGKRIILEGEDAHDSWRIRVIDFGPGIDDNYKEGIFARFQRKDKKGVKGSGLGLTIAKKIVDIHKGKIWVEDNPEGGAVFIVELPKT